MGKCLACTQIISGDLKCACYVDVDWRELIREAEERKRLEAEIKRLKEGCSKGEKR